MPDVEPMFEPITEEEYDDVLSTIHARNDLEREIRRRAQERRFAREETDREDRMEQRQVEKERRVLGAARARIRLLEAAMAEAIESLPADHPTAIALHRALDDDVKS
jgi:hypothetical protein